MAKRGRPSKYRPEYAAQARKLCLLGATDMEMADFFGCSVPAFYRWQAENSAFRKAIKLGKAAPDERVERSLYHRAIGYSHQAVKIFADPKTGAEKIVKYTEHYPPETAAAIFWLKNRKPLEWRDRIDVTNSDGSFSAGFAALIAREGDANGQANPGSSTH